MKELIKKELNKFSLEPSLIDNFIESVSEGLNQNGIEIWINTIKSFSNSQTSRIIIKNIIEETPAILRSIPQSQYL